MSRHLLEKNASTIADVLSFKANGYFYSEAETTDANAPVFVR